MLQHEMRSRRPQLHQALQLARSFFLIDLRLKATLFSLYSRMFKVPNRLENGHIVYAQCLKKTNAINDYSCMDYSSDHACLLNLKAKE